MKSTDCEGVEQRCQVSQVLVPKPMDGCDKLKQHVTSSCIDGFSCFEFIHNISSSQFDFILEMKTHFVALILFCAFIYLESMLTFPSACEAAREAFMVEQNPGLD